MLRARLATAAVGVPALLWLIFLAPYGAYRAIIVGITLLGLVEFFQMAFQRQLLFQALGVGAGGFAAFAMATATPGAIADAALALSAILMIVLMGGLIAALFAPDEPGKSIARLGIVLFGILYAGAILPHFIWLRAVTDNGPAWVLFVLAVAFLGDTGGYFAGRAYGKTPLMPAVSPKKTIEGSVGALGGNVVAAVGMKLLLIPEAGWIEILFLAVVGGVLGQIGDLSESLMKRGFGAKDSGWLLPGHGGLLDRTDSLVFPLIFVYYYLSFVKGPT